MHRSKKEGGVGFGMTMEIKGFLFLFCFWIDHEFEREKYLALVSHLSFSLL